MYSFSFFSDVLIPSLTTWLFKSTCLSQGQWLRPSYSGSRDQEYHGSRPIQAKSSKDPITTIKVRCGGMHVTPATGNINRRIVVQA
jgi:hypothetical protein